VRDELRGLILDEIKPFLEQGVLGRREAFGKDKPLGGKGSAVKFNARYF